MTSINKHQLLAVALVILKKRRRHENRKNEKKKIWLKKMNKNQPELGAFSITFLLTKEFDHAFFFLSKQIEIYPLDCLNSVFA